MCNVRDATLRSWSTTTLAERLAELGVDPADAMAPFVEPIEEFHAKTAPSDWYESLVKAYVGDGIASDFYREVAHQLDGHTRDLVLDVCSDTGHANFAVADSKVNQSTTGE